MSTSSFIPSFTPPSLIVIGASLGGMETLKNLLTQLPSELNAALLVVWHIPPESPNLLPDILQRVTELAVVSAQHGQLIEPGHAYIARPDFHLVVGGQESAGADPNLVTCLTRGPKENRFRPSIDVLFRSVAVNCGSRVIGVILTGALDDGAAGLYAIKKCGGRTLVQDPLDAVCPNMPDHALRAVQVDACVPVAGMGQVLLEWTREPLPQGEAMCERQELEGWKTEVNIALQGGNTENNVLNLGATSIYTCPECHGVLTEIEEGNRFRFRCHTGHAFSSDTLLAEVTKSAEISLWNSLRAIEESELLLNRLAEHLRSIGQIEAAEACLTQIIATRRLANVIRAVAIEAKALSTEKITT